MPGIRAQYNTDMNHVMVVHREMMQFIDDRQSVSLEFLINNINQFFGKECFIGLDQALDILMTTLHGITHQISQTVEHELSPEKLGDSYTDTLTTVTSQTENIMELYQAIIHLCNERQTDRYPICRQSVWDNIMNIRKGLSTIDHQQENRKEESTMPTDNPSAADDQVKHDFRAILNIYDRMFRYINSGIHEDGDLTQLKESIDHDCSTLSVDTGDTINMLLESIADLTKSICNRAQMNKSNGLPIHELSRRMMCSLSVSVALRELQLKYRPLQALAYVRDMTKQIDQWEHEETPTE